MAKSYRDLEIWKLARELSISIHAMSLQLPSFELYEQGSQIRRSSKSVRANIVEGYGKRRYKQEFLQYLYRALGSCSETLDHLECLHETGSLKDQECYDQLHALTDMLGRKLNLFIAAVQRTHISEK